MTHLDIDPKQPRPQIRGKFDVKLKVEVVRVGMTGLALSYDGKTTDRLHPGDSVELSFDYYVNPEP